MSVLLLGAVVLVLLTNVAILAVLLGTLRRASRLVQDAHDAVVSFMVSASPDSPSQFAETIDKVAAIFSARLVTSAKAALRGSAGGLAKAEAEAGEQAAITENPLLGLLGGKLGKNPLAAMALSAIGSKLFGQGAPASGGSNNGGHPRFRL